MDLPFVSIVKIDSVPCLLSLLFLSLESQSLKRELLDYTALLVLQPHEHVSGDLHPAYRKIHPPHPG